MAKRNFGFPGGGGANMQQMMKQAQKLQQQVLEMSENLDSQLYEATSGGGMVSCTINGKHELVGLTIKPEVVDPDDVDMLQDLILAAVNECLRKVDDAKENAFSAIAPGMGGLF
ncbi:MAG: YbaB/EbfC family nucleoid-associated protein [Clostridia bacterium]|nr:YbaB/EbfC family nucleoid-associated protein [Clostridia bacterium]